MKIPHFAFIFTNDLFTECVCSRYIFQNKKGEDYLYKYCVVFDMFPSTLGHASYSFMETRHNG